GPLQPCWSPDGTEIGYVRDAVIEAIDLRDGTVRTLVPEASSCTPGAPSCSPHARRLALLRTHAGTRRLLLSQAPSEERPVGALDDVFPFPPRWLSEDELLYTGNGGIAISGLAGGDTRTVPFTAAFELSRPSYPRKRYDFDRDDERPVKGIVGPAL